MQTQTVRCPAHLHASDRQLTFGTATNNDQCDWSTALYLGLTSCASTASTWGASDRWQGGGACSLSASRTLAEPKQVPRPRGADAPSSSSARALFTSASDAPSPSGAPPSAGAPSARARAASPAAGSSPSSSWKSGSWAPRAPGSHTLSSRVRKCPHLSRPSARCQSL